MNAGPSGRTLNRLLTDDHGATAIRYLARLAVGNGGYFLAGVWGWAHRRDIETAKRIRLDGTLPGLHSAGLVERLNAGVASLQRPEWLYRITPAGAELVASRWSDVVSGIELRGALEADHAVYVHPRTRTVLRVLRHALTDGGPERIPRETGWRTGRDLAALVDILNRRSGGKRFHRIDSMDLKWLAAAGLAEKRDPGQEWGRRERGLVCWRVSERGQSVSLLCFRRPEPIREATGRDRDCARFEGESLPQHAHPSGQNSRWKRVPEVHTPA